MLTMLLMMALTNSRNGALVAPVPPVAVGLVVPSLVAIQPPVGSFGRRANVTVRWDEASPTAVPLFVAAFSPPDFELPVQFLPVKLTLD